MIRVRALSDREGSGRELTKRLVLVVPTLVGAASLVFIAIRLAPGDPAAVLLGAFATPQGDC